MPATPDTPAFTKPEEEPIVATVSASLLHVPPLLASVSVVVEPEQMNKLPEIAAGNASTVTVTLVLQPVINA